MKYKRLLWLCVALSWNSLSTSHAKRTMDIGIRGCTRLRQPAMTNVQGNSAVKNQVY